MFRRGIRTRLMYSFFIVTSFSLLLVASYVLWYVYNHDLNGLMANMSVECDIVDELLHDELLDSLKRDNVDSQVKDLGRRVGLRMTVIDRDGTPLADSDADPALMENHSNRPEVLAALSGQKGTAVRFSDTTSENLLYMAIPVYDGNHVIAAIRLATSLTHIEDGFNKIRNAMIAAFLITFILAIAVSARLARKYTAPLEEIAETSREIANGKLETRVHLKTGDELEILAHAINNLTSHLEDKINETTAEKNKLELILEHMDNGVIMFDKYGKVLSVNKMAAFRFAITEKMIGQHNMNVIGKSVLDQTIQQTLESGENQSMDLSLRVDNVKRIYQVSLAPIRDNDLAIHAVLAVFHDITTLQEMQERQSEFVANASHELATPLTAIKGFTETLLDGAMHDPALSQKFLTIIFNESERMARLIKDLLQLAKLDSQSGETKPNSDPVALGPLVQHVVEDLTPYWKNKNLTVTIAAENDPLWVKAHPDWVKQILSNLLENAVKYTPEDGKITLSYRAEDQLAVIAVQDTGIGIPAKDLPFIFDRFYRVDRARSRKAGGTGLGLSIVKFIVETLGGKITVTSQPEVGSVFTVFLPRSIQ